MSGVVPAEQQGLYMKAVGYARSLPIEDPEALMDLELPMPVAGAQDLLVRIRAIAVNPVDTKVRKRSAPDSESYRVLGWDAVGEVMAVGEEVAGFRQGDRVYYAGDLNRPGCNAEYQCVDARLAALAPDGLSDAEAAALPLTTITAWELLFDHLGICRLEDEGAQQCNAEILLIVGAAGGVGSMLIQLARALTGATVIATASRSASRNWVRSLGAHFIIDHTQPLRPQLDALDTGPVTHIASLNGTDEYFDQYPDLLVPFGRIALIDDPERSLDVMKLKPRSQSLHIEFMFARSMWQAPDLQVQGQLLQEVAGLMKQGRLQSTAGTHLGLICAEHLRAAHAELESGKTIGKIVLEGF